MTCPCESTICTCDEKCFCRKINCQCSKCALLSKICSRCRLPVQAANAEQSYEHEFCSCDNRVQGLRSASLSLNSLSLQSTESERSYESSMILEGRVKCSRCNFPIFIVSADKTTNHNATFCSCPLKKRTLRYPELQSEHETSSSTSDHRKISTDRQVRKALSRKLRTEKSNWQAKKVKACSSNSAGEYSINEETVHAEPLPAGASSLSLVGYDKQYNIMLSSQGGITEDVQNLNASFYQSQRGFCSRTGDTSTANASLLVNSSGISSLCTPVSSNRIENIGFFPLNLNHRARLPHPFPRLPQPIQGLPAFRKQLCRSPFLVQSFYTPRRKTPRPFLPENAIVQYKEKLDKWFETLKNVLDTSGELPDADAAAIIDKLDKEKRKDEQYSINPERFAHCSSAAAISYNGKDKDNIEPTTDTDISTTLFKSHKES